MTQQKKCWGAHRTLWLVIGALSAACAPVPRAQGAQEVPAMQRIERQDVGRPLAASARRETVRYLEQPWVLLKAMEKVKMDGVPTRSEAAIRHEVAASKLAEQAVGTVAEKPTPEPTAVAALASAPAAAPAAAHAGDQVIPAAIAEGNKAALVTSEQPTAKALAQQWEVLLSDVTLDKTFERWARAAGYRVKWDAAKNFLVEAHETFHGDFESAVWDALATPGIIYSDYPLEGCVYPNSPPLMRITRRGEQVRECVALTR
jgi:hypothetical protein